MHEGAIPLAADRPTSDEVALWVAEAKRGSLEAFDRLIARFERRVFAIVYPLAGDAEDAREIAQETFLRAWRSLHRFREGAPFEPWLFRIAVNLAVNERRRRGAGLRAVSSLREGVESPGPAAEEEFLREERARLLRGALDGLSPRERAAVVLRELQGMETEEVARILDLDPVTVRRHVARGLAHLRKILRNRHPELLR